MPITVLDPTTHSEAAAPRYAPKLPSLEGRRIGILDNRKANADRLLDEVETIMRTRYGVRGVRSPPETALQPTCPAGAIG